MKTTRGMIESERFETPYRAYGDSERRLVCVSGAMQTMAIWRTMVRRFASDFTVVVFDMPGIGRSTIKSGGSQVSVQEQLEVLGAIIQRTQRSGELTLAGASWGTVIAASYAALKPDAVQHLVLSSFGMTPNLVLGKLLRRALGLYHEGDYARGADLILEMFGSRVESSYRRQIVSQFERLNESDAEAFYEHCANVLTLGRLDEAIDLTQIKARTLIVNGAEDALINLEDMDVAKSLIPNCQTRLMQDVGHFLHFEKPELLEEYVEFMLGEERSSSFGTLAPSAPV